MSTIIIKMFWLSGQFKAGFHKFVEQQSNSMSCQRLMSLGKDRGNTSYGVKVDANERTRE